MSQKSEIRFEFVDLSVLKFLSKAARGRPEGPTERSVFKIIFVMLAVLQLRIRQIYKVENVTWPVEKNCEPMAE